MASRTAELIARLTDEVSGPARGMAGALKGVTAAGRDLGKLGSAPGLDRLTAQLNCAKAQLQAVEKLRNAQANVASAKMGLAGPTAEAQRLTKALDEARAKAAQFDGIKAFSKTSGIGKEIADTRKAVSDLAKEEAVAQRAMRSATGAVEQHERALQRARQALNGFGVPIVSLQRHEDALKATVDRTTAAINKQTQAIRQQQQQQQQQQVAESPRAGRRPNLLVPPAEPGRVGTRERPQPRRTLGPLGGAFGVYGAAGAYKQAAAFDRRLTMIGQTADASRAEIDAMGGSIFELAQQTAVPVDKVAGGLEALVAQGRSLKEGLEFLPSVARTAAASGAEVEDIAKTADSVGSNFKIAGKQMQTAFDIMAAGGKAGQFELKDMARYLPSLGPATAAIGFKGENGLADLVSMLQVMRKGSGTAEEAVSSMNNILSKMESDKTTKGFKELGVDAEKAFEKARKEGRNLVEVFEELLQQATKGDTSKIGKIIDDQEFKRGALALMSFKGEWQTLSSTLQSNSAGTVMRDIVQVTKDSQAAVDRLSTSWQRFIQGAAKAGDAAGLTSALGDTGKELEGIAGALERINNAYKEGGVKGAVSQIAGDVAGTFRENKKAYLDQDREAQVKRIKEMEEGIAATRKSLEGKGYSKERVDGTVRSQEMQLRAERRALENIAANRAALDVPDKMPLRMGSDPTAPISGAPGAVGPGVAGFQQAYPLDISGRKPLPTSTPLPPARPAGMPMGIDRIEDVLGPKLKALSTETISPKVDSAEIDGLGTKADAAQEKLTALGGVSVAPTVDTASIAAAQAMAEKLLSTLNGIGPAAGRAGAAVNAASGLVRAQSSSPSFSDGVTPGRGSP